MKKFNLKKALGTLSAAGLLVAAACTQTSCIGELWSEQHPGTYYVNSGETIASFLEEGEYKDSFTDFVYILKRANIWGELRTYGEHTCFAPDNAAFDEYLANRKAGAPDSIKHYFESLETLPDYICDSIAKTHLCNATFFCTDMSGDGAFPFPNLLDRYLTYYSFPDTVYYQDDNGVDTFNIHLVYKINQVSQILEADDTVQNGVVHIVDKVLAPSNKFIPGLLKTNNDMADNAHKATIFYDAIMATRLSDRLEEYVDINYPTVSYDSTLACFTSTGKTALKKFTSYEEDWGVVPEKRLFKFTVFVVTDSVLEEKYGITDLDGLRDKAKEVYGADGDTEDESSSSNSLNKLIAYHILPSYLTYDQFNTSQKEITDKRKYWDELDVEDFYETVMPHGLMRISTPADKKDIYINRKGTEKLGNLIPGIRIWRSSEYGNLDATALNGGYHFVDGLLLYDKTTREDNLNCRIRIMANSMSPDFINSNARGRLQVGSKRYVTGFLKGFCTNFEALNDLTEYWVRYRDQNFGTYYGDEMTIRGIYDIAIKLPPVPTDGTYEVRIWNNSMAGTSVGGRGVAQFYFREGKNGEWKPCGIPVDLRLAGDDPRVGFIKDSDITKNIQDEKEQQRAIDMHDKAMRNHGYMKAPDSYGDLRDDGNCGRKILCNEFFRADGDYYIRLRQVLEDPNAVCPFNFVEIVPKNIYAGEIVTEDRH